MSSLYNLMLFSPPVYFFSVHTILSNTLSISQLKICLQVPDG